MLMFIGHSWFSIKQLPMGTVMTSIKDPLLVVWEAINLVIEVDFFPDAPHVSKLVAEAEEALFRLTIELARRAELEFTIPEPAGGALH
jgi:hypothetical protein